MRSVEKGSFVLRQRGRTVVPATLGSSRDFVLVTLAGEVLWRGTKIARLKVPYDFGQDLLDGLGRSLGAQLHADPGFTAALAAAAQKRAEVRP